DRARRTGCVHSGVVRRDPVHAGIGILPGFNAGAPGYAARRVVFLWRGPAPPNNASNRTPATIAIFLVCRFMAFEVGSDQRATLRSPADAGESPRTTLLFLRADLGQDRVGGLGQQGSEY